MMHKYMSSFWAYIVKLSELKKKKKLNSILLKRV